MKETEREKGAVSGVEHFVQDYEKLRPLYESFTEQIVELLKTLLANANIKPHAIEGRTKDIIAFREKIIRQDKNYDDPIAEVTDLSGVRIIVYRIDDIEAVASLIESEFIINRMDSAFQNTELEPEEFGYQSLHYIVSLSNERKILFEWSKVKDLCAEVQIRTVLQHAWAQISHALQYKQEVEMTTELRRRLARLASLLELADEEFSAIFKGKLEIQSKVAVTGPAEDMTPK
jgi:ppGpp synthetase/RelA/SpoT-type nucleotidyltranferase